MCLRMQTPVRHLSSPDPLVGPSRASGGVCKAPISYAVHAQQVAELSIPALLQWKCSQGHLAIVLCPGSIRTRSGMQARTSQQEVRKPLGSTSAGRAMLQKKVTGFADMVHWAECVPQTPLTASSEAAPQIQASKPSFPDRAHSYVT